MSKQNKEKNKNSKLLFMALIAVIIICLVVVVLIYQNQKNKEKEITYDQLYQDIIDKKVEKIEMTIGGAGVTIKYKDSDDEKTTNVNSLQPFMEFINEQLKENPGSFKVDLKTPSKFISILENFFSFLPTILLIVLMIMIFKMQGIGEKGKVYGDSEENHTGVKFKNVSSL